MFNMRGVLSGLSSEGIDVNDAEIRSSTIVAFIFPRNKDKLDEE